MGKKLSKYGIKLFKSSLKVSLLVLFLFCILLSYVLVSTHDSIAKLNYDFINFVSQYIDMQILEAQKYSQELELHPVNMKLKNISTPLKEISVDLYSFFDQIRSTKLVNENIEKVLILFPNSDISISDIGVYPISSYSKLENFITQETETIFSIENDFNQNFSIAKYLGRNTLSYNNGIFSKGEKVGVITILIDMDSLLSPLYFSENTLFIVSYKGAELTRIGTLDEDKQNLIVYDIPSAQTPDLHYIFKYDSTSFYKPIFNALIICILAIIIILGITIYLSIRFSKREAQPINEILDKIGYNSNEGSEIEIISNKISSLLSEKNISLEIIQSRQFVINALFLNLILSEQNITDEKALRIASRYGITFDSSYFTVAVIRSKNTPDSFRDAISSELGLEFREDVFTTYRDGDYVLLYNSDDQEISPFISEEIKRLFATVFSDYSTFATIGLTYTTLSEIKNSYKDAIDAIERHPLLSDREIIEAENEKDNNDKLIIAEFKTLLWQKKYKIASENITENNYMILLPLVKNEYYNKQKEYSIPADVKPIFSENENKEYVIAEMRNVLSLLNEVKPDLNNLSLVEKAKKIIDVEFSDPMLGLYSIAESIGVTNSYLSSIFKDSEGVGINHYINKKRIDMAKDLLINTDLTIKDIALSTGFLSDISFIRVFKKYEEATPSSIRKKDSTKM